MDLKTAGINRHEIDEEPEEIEEEDYNFDAPMEDLIIDLQGWTDPVKDIIGKLEQLTKSTEDDFLVLGSDLQSFYERADKMAVTSANVAALMSGEKLQQAIDGLGSLLFNLKEYMDGFSRDSGESMGRLKSVGTLLDELVRPLNNLKVVVVSLLMMGFSIKIESARLGNVYSDFGNLANDVKSLASYIDSKSSSILDQSESLNGLLKDTVNRTYKIQSVHQFKIEDILREARSTLETMKQINERSTTLIKNISARSEDISSSTGQIVMSIQFQDITRQQVEHVRDAVKDTLEMIERVAAGADSIQPQEMVRFVGDAFRLQRAQIRNSRLELSGAVERIISSLRKVAESVSDITFETSRLAGDSRRNEASLLLKIEEGLSTVARSLKKSATIGKDLSETVVSSTAQIGEISRFVDDIEETGSNVELIALNARVKAAHTREKGATMGVLAESIQKVSLQSLSHANTVSKILNDISSATSHLKEYMTGENQDRDSLVGELVLQMDSLMESLKTINDEVRSSLRDLDNLGDTLSYDIMKSVDKIHVHETFSRMIDELDGRMEMLEMESRDLVSDTGESYKSSELEQMASRYTMEAERKVHNSALQGESSAGDDIFFDSDDDGLFMAEPEKIAGEDDLGDNIELF